MSVDQPSGPAGFVPVNPYELARREKAEAQIKRFYAEARAEACPDGFTVLLDGRPMRTPARRGFVLPGESLARDVADEWNRQGPVVEPGAMPMTRLANTALDGVADTMDAVRAEVARFAGSDLLCYRAGAPADLVDRQAAAWDPMLAWAREALDASLVRATGIMFVAQPDPALRAVDAALAVAVGTGRGAPFRLAALHVATTLTGSVVLALGIAHEAVTVEQAWAKAHVDEDFQISQWGEDEEAAARRAARWADMQAAGRVLAALR